MFDLKLETNVNVSVDTTDILQYTIETVNMFDDMIAQATEYERLFAITDFSNEGIFTTAKDMLVKFCKWLVDMFKKLIGAILRFFGLNNGKVTTGGETVDVNDPKTWTNIDKRLKKTPLKANAELLIPYDLKQVGAISFTTVANQEGTRDVDTVEELISNYSRIISQMIVQLKERHTVDMETYKRIDDQVYTAKQVYHYGSNVLRHMHVYLQTMLESCKVVLEKYANKINPNTISVDLLGAMSDDIMIIVCAKGKPIFRFRDMHATYENAPEAALPKIAKNLLTLVKRVLVNKTTESSALLAIMTSTYKALAQEVNMVHLEVPVPPDMVSRLEQFYKKKLNLKSVIISSSLNINPDDYNGRGTGGEYFAAGKMTSTSIAISFQYLNNRLFRYNLANAYREFKDAEIPIKSCTRELGFMSTLIHECKHMADHQGGKDLEYETGPGAKKYEDHDFERDARQAARTYKPTSADIAWVKKILAQLPLDGD